MLIILNGYDWIGQKLLNSKAISPESILHVETTQCMRKMAILVDRGMPIFEYGGFRYRLADCQAIYCGHLHKPTHDFRSTCQHNIDKDYIIGAWHAWLQYWCIRIPRRVGVLPDTLWLGTLLHLPALYQRAVAIGIAVPSLRYMTREFVMLSEDTETCWYGLEGVRPRCIEDFGLISESTRVAVQYHAGNWVQLLVVADSVMALQLHCDGVWCRYDVPEVLRCLVVQLVASYDMTIAAILLRKGDDGAYLLYALDWHVPAVFQSYYGRDALHAVWEILYDA